MAVTLDSEYTGTALVTVDVELTIKGLTYGEVSSLRCAVAENARDIIADALRAAPSNVESVRIASAKAVQLSISWSEAAK